jgi:hypothetical protein
MQKETTDEHGWEARIHQGYSPSSRLAIQPFGCSSISYSTPGFGTTCTEWLKVDMGLDKKKQGIPRREVQFLQFKIWLKSNSVIVAPESAWIFGLQKRIQTSED